MKTPMAGLGLKSLLSLQTAIGACLTAIVWLRFGPQLGASFGAGAAIMLVNLLLLAWIWSRFLAKKSIAWTVVIIVIKYTVLLSAIFLLTQKVWFHVLSCGLGMATFVMTALVQVAVWKKE